MINLGNMSIADLRLGASQVQAAYFGSEQIWGGEEPGPVGDWLCFTAEQANSQVWFKSGGQTRYFETSTDGQNWSTYTLDTHISLPNISDKVYFRAATGQTNTKIGDTWQGRTAFAGSGKIAASGDIKYLVSQDGDTSGIDTQCCCGLFKDMAALTKAPKLGIMNPLDNCYDNAFYGCTGLTEAPELPATTLASACYINMFQNCTGIRSYPYTLPATVLASSCYAGLFYGCSSLSAAPALPVTTLAYGCYDSMFRNCTSLTEAPELPAMTLANNCYINMFNGCTNLSSMNIGLTSWVGSNATTDWVRNVAASGTFTCPATLPDERGTSRIPTGWNVVHPQQEISAVCFTAEEANSTVKLYKYNSGAPTLDIETSTDGSNWTAYTQGTVLTAANVGDKVYFRAGSTGNPTISVRSNTNRFAITGKMAASGDIQYLLSQDGTTQPTTAWCFNCLFYGQGSLSKAPKCGATSTRDIECYGGTFEQCTGLTEYVDTPLPQMWQAGEYLPHWTYINMFKNCSNLSAIAVNWTSWPMEGSITGANPGWLANVKSTGVFYCPSSLPDKDGEYGIPTGWTRVNI